MKNKYFILVTYLTIILCFYGCTTKKTNCNLDLLLCNVSTDNKLSDDARQLLLPFESGEQIILPQGNIFNTSDTISYVKESSWLERVRGNLTKNTSILLLKEKISNYLTTIDLSPLKNENKVTLDYINTIKKNYDFTFVYYQGMDKNNFSSELLSFSKPEDLIKHLSDSIMVVNPQCKILIVFNPTLKKDIEEQKPTELDTITKLTLSADSALAAANYTKAVELYEKIVALQPNNQSAKDRIIIIKQNIYQVKEPDKKTAPKSSETSNPTTIKKKIDIELVPFYGLSIDEKLIKIADEKNPISKRRIYKDIALEDFTSNESTVYIEPSDTSKVLKKQSISEYLNNLYETHNYKIVVTQKDIGTNGKISSIHLTESYR